MKKITEISVGIIREEDKVLIIERPVEKSNTGVELKWAFPGGKVERDEEPQDTVEREVKEETGYQIRAINLIDKRQHPEFPVLVGYWNCKVMKKLNENQPNEEIISSRWVRAEDLFKYFTTDLNPKVAEFLGIVID